MKQKKCKIILSLGPIFKNSRYFDGYVLSKLAVITRWLWNGFRYLKKAVKEYGLHCELLILHGMYTFSLSICEGFFIRINYDYYMPTKYLSA